VDRIGALGKWKMDERTHRHPNRQTSMERLTRRGHSSINNGQSRNRPRVAPVAIEVAACIRPMLGVDYIRTNTEPGRLGWLPSSSVASVQRMHGLQLSHQEPCRAAHGTHARWSMTSSPSLAGSQVAG
jgi:hypothetical protein